MKLKKFFIGILFLLIIGIAYYNCILCDSEKNKLNANYDISFMKSNVDKKNGDISNFHEDGFSQMNAKFDKTTRKHSVTVSAEDMEIPYDPAVIPVITFDTDSADITDFSIDMIMDDPVLNSSIAGYIGNGYKFNVKHSDEVILAFKYDKSFIPYNIDIKEFKPTIYQYNFDKKELRKIDNQKCDNDVISAKITDLSAGYILLNEPEIEKYIDNAK